MKIKKSVSSAIISESIRTFRRFRQTQTETISVISEKIISAFKRGSKVIVFGNGGSAADAQHFAAELLVKFEKRRKALPAIALNTNTSAITACANDFSYEDIFSRQLEALLSEGDVVIGISTSGNSPNVVKALEYAARNFNNVETIAFTGEDGGKVKEIAHITLRAPHQSTARVQECHILAIHAICKIIETSLEP